MESRCPKSLSSYCLEDFLKIIPWFGLQYDTYEMTAVLHDHMITGIMTSFMQTVQKLLSVRILDSASPKDFMYLLNQWNERTVRVFLDALLQPILVLSSVRALGSQAL